MIFCWAIYLQAAQSVDKSLDFAFFAQKRIYIAPFGLDLSLLFSSRKQFYAAFLGAFPPR